MPGYIDAHVHLWDTGRHRMDWVEAEPGLADRYLLDDYRSATADDPPDGFVFVQAGVADADGTAEARWVESVCAPSPDFAGMVVWAPVDAGSAAVDHHLDDLDGLAVRGVRRLIQGDPPGLCTRPPFVEAVAALGRRDLVFDVCILPSHLDDAAQLARGAPDTRLVVDHLAKPGIGGDGFEHWRDGLVALGDLDNVWCKLSGLVTEADPDHWTVADLRPWVETALEVFGPRRLLWGSDWPVVTLAASHRRWREATTELLGGLGPDERAMIRSTNATEVYRLGEE